eukprot:scaffold81581_cov42-Phaeocystis_antarctica.AAC.1
MARPRDARSRPVRPACGAGPPCRHFVRSRCGSRHGGLSVESLRIRNVGRGWRPCPSLSLGPAWHNRSSRVQSATQSPLCQPQEARVASCSVRKTALSACVEAAAGGAAERECEEREGGGT